MEDFVCKRGWVTECKQFLPIRRFSSIVHRRYHRHFLLLSSAWRCHFEDGFLNFVEIEKICSYVARLQRYWCIFRSKSIYIYLIHQTLYRLQWPRVGHNVNKLVVCSYVTQPFNAIFEDGFINFKEKIRKCWVILATATSLKLFAAKWSVKTMSLDP